jgi:hypothetical protein
MWICCRLRTDCASIVGAEAVLNNGPSADTLLPAANPLTPGWQVMDIELTLQNFVVARVSTVIVAPAPKSAGKLFSTKLLAPADLTVPVTADSVRRTRSLETVIMLLDTLALGALARTCTLCPTVKVAKALELQTQVRELRRRDPVIINLIVGGRTHLHVNDHADSRVRRRRRSRRSLSIQQRNLEITGDVGDWRKWRCQCW